MKELIKSAVVFNEEQHTYTLGDKELSGITSIIRRYLFANMYANVSQAVLNKAAERGTRIHNLVQLWTMGILSQQDLAELQPFLDALSGAGLLNYESEYLVSDNESVASSIDLVCLNKDDNIFLCDIKTTAVLHIDYLAWQLSIYAYLFERQNPELKVNGLKAIHIRDGKCNIVDIPRLEDEAIERLLTAYRNGAETFDNPLAVLPEDLNRLLEAYSDNESLLATIKMVEAEYENKKKELQEKIAESLKANGMDKAETDIAKVTIGKDSERQTFDLKKFMESPMYKYSPENYSEFIKSSVTKGRVTITLK